jgi:hypothetical protein
MRFTLKSRLILFHFRRDIIAVLWFGFCPSIKNQFDLPWHDHPGVSKSAISPVFHLHSPGRLLKVP